MGFSCRAEVVILSMLSASTEQKGGSVEGYVVVPGCGMRYAVDLSEGCSGIRGSRFEVCGEDGRQMVGWKIVATNEK